VPRTLLLDPDSPIPVEIPGFGPVPVALLADGEGQKTIRRPFTRDGVVIGGNPRAAGPTAPAPRSSARDDGRCTAPYCDTPIHHIDHRVRHSDDGPTELGNGDGYCALHDYAEEIGVSRRPRREREPRPRSP
jgi:hypothetical protein